MNITDWFTGAGRAIHDAFTRLFGTNTASLLLVAQKQVFDTAIGSFAVQVVTDLQPITDLTSEQKWVAAGTKIAAQAVVLGIDIAQSEINLLIELVYTAVRHQQPIHTASPRK